MNFKTKKAKRELVYLASATIILSICIWLDPYSLARFVGRTIGKLGNPDFQIVLALGGVIALQKDIVLAAISAAVLEIIISFSSVKEWRQSVGLNPSDGEVILLIGLPTLVGTFVLYLLEMSAKRVGRITDDQDKSQFVREQSFWRLNQ